MGLHGNASLFRFAYPFGSYRGITFVRLPQADDEDGTAGHLCPKYALDDCWKVLQAFVRLDRGSMPCELEPLEDGDEIEIGREWLITALRTQHTVPSLGFLVEQRRQK